MSARTTILAASVSAALLWAAAPPIGLGPLAWVALVPAATAALGAGGSRWGRAVVPLAYALYLESLLVPALPFGLTDDQWGEAPVPLLIGHSPVLAVALILVPLFGLILYALGFPQPFARGLDDRRPALALAAVLVPAVCWTALDLARVKLDPGGLWGPLFVSQHDAFAARLATLGGPWLITFAIVTVNWALALIVLRRRAAAPAAALAAGLVVFLLVAAPGPPPAGGGRTLTVAAVQPGYDTADFEQPVLRYFHPGTYELAALDMIADLGALTRRAAARGADLIVWPEAALWVDPRREPRVRRALGRLARRVDAEIVVPYFLPGPAHGATLVVGTGGGLSPPQPKQRPMWFWGEDGGNRTSPRPVAASFGDLGTTLGVDNQDPRPTRLLAGRGAEVVSSSTHDWAQLAPTQQAFAELHAVETRAPLVRADWRYGSAVFDGGGRRLADAGEEAQRIAVTATVARRASSTPYEEIGDLIGWAAAALAVLFCATGFAVRPSRPWPGGGRLVVRSRRLSANS